MTNYIIKKIQNRKDLDKSEIREQLGIFSGILGIICNILLCIFKFGVGSLTGSVSITADAVNNLSDAASSIVTVAGTKLSNKPVDREHPFGHGRIEYISGLIVSFFILLMGFELAKSSVEKIINPNQIKFNIWYLIILLFAIAVKLYMAYVNSKLYKITENINLKAIRQDSLNDCIATGATVIALLIGSFTNFRLADGIIGLIVAVIILIAGFKTMRDIINPLLGQPPSKELVESIEQIMMSNSEIIGVHDLIVHNYGPGRIIASAHAEVPSTGDIVVIHDAIDNVEKEIAHKLNIVMCIHMDPIAVNDETVEKYKKITTQILHKINDKCTFHDFKVIIGPTHKNLIFDLVTPYDNKENAPKLLAQLKEEFMKYDDTINLVVTVEHSYI